MRQKGVSGKLYGSQHRWEGRRNKVDGASLAGRLPAITPQGCWLRPDPEAAGGTLLPRVVRLRAVRLVPFPVPLRSECSLSPVHLIEKLHHIQNPDKKQLWKLFLLLQPLWRAPPRGLNEPVHRVCPSGAAGKAAGTGIRHREPWSLIYSADIC